VAAVTGGRKRISAELSGDEFCHIRHRLDNSTKYEVQMQCSFAGLHSSQNGKAERKETGANYNCLQRVSVKKAKMQRPKARV
jgi:hypothetical protein